MIASLKGVLTEKNPPRVVVECAGVGYEADVPMSTFCNLPSIDQEVKLLTVMIVREDAQLLYGFLTREEKDLFSRLIKVNGIGPKIALAMLSSIAPAELIGAISSQNTALLVKVPGIGKRTAERLIVELKDKLGELPGVPVSIAAHSEILQGLTALGFNDREAQAAVAKLPDGVEVAEGIRLSLRYLSQKG